MPSGLSVMGKRRVGEEGARVFVNTRLLKNVNS